jgi:hypothetical protein
MPGLSYFIILIQLVLHYELVRYGVPRNTPPLRTVAVKTISCPP